MQHPEEVSAQDLFDLFVTVPAVQQLLGDIGKSAYIGHLHRSVSDPIQFRADKPFLYVIRENSTEALLFMGKVGKPEYEQ